MVTEQTRAAVAAAPSLGQAAEGGSSERMRLSSRLRNLRLI